MKQKRLTMDELRAWVERLLPDHRVVAPVRVEEGLALLQQVAAAAEVDMACGRPANSIKEFFFPATEEILHVRRGKTAVDLQVPPLERPQVLFAIRPCDAAALVSMDALFLGDPADPYWAARRQDTAIVGLACQEVPTPECFCTTVGGSPIGTENMDLVLYEEGGGYVVEALTDRGAALLERAGGETLAEPYTPRRPELPPLPCLPYAEWPRLFNDPYWQRLGERCLGCKICTYNCPTCYCFDIRDRGAGGEVERLRAWDACTGKHYSVEASGHDPRPTRGARLRNRFYHKYYYFPWRYDGLILCSGCGRCVAQCPVNIDLTQVLEDVAALAEAQP